MNADASRSESEPDVEMMTNGRNSEENKLRFCINRIKMFDPIASYLKRDKNELLATKMIFFLYKLC